MNLVDFIINAKKQTYAGGKSSRKLKDGFEQFVYNEGDYRYKDKYYAKSSGLFGGEEIVWKKKNAVWIMNYYGYIMSDKIDDKKVYEFLVKAMSLVDKQRPFRGPSYFKDGDFEYIDESEGKLDNFKGTEKILYKGTDIYKLEYHGGRI